MTEPVDTVAIREQIASSLTSRLGRSYTLTAFVEQSTEP